MLWGVYCQMSVMALVEDLLPQLSATEREGLAAQFAQIPVQHWAKGECLFVEHRAFQHLVLIQTGVVRSFYLDHDTE
ncbi:MAG: hypothetical protein VXW65_13595, partial [Pseudomonadota bacterium]|nr:hypothetical protein [Pseudomonadota bacterium]